MNQQLQPGLKQTASSSRGVVGAALLAGLLLLVSGCPSAGAPIRATSPAPDDSATDDREKADKIGRVEVTELERGEESLEDAMATIPPATAPPPADGPAMTPGGDAGELPGLDLSDARLGELVEPRLARAREELAAGDHTQAIAEARAALEIQNDNIAAIVLLSQAYFEKGWLAKAEQVLMVATAYPAGERDARVWMLMGLVRERRRADLRDVADAYLKATKLKPNYVKAWNNLGAVYLKRGEYQAAIAAFENSLSIDSNAVLALTNGGTAYRRMAHQVADRKRRDELLRKAEASYRAAIAINQTHAPAYLNLGLLFLDCDEFPGMDTLSRLQTSIRYLREFKQRGWSQSSGADSPAAAIDQYLDLAQQKIDSHIRAEKSRSKSEKKPGRARGRSE